MANIIQIKRSTGSDAPSGLQAGELAYSGGTGTQSNGGQRLFIGDPSTGNNKLIGGEYFTAMLDQVAGTLTASSAILVDANSKIDKLLSGNIRINNTAGQIDTSAGNLTIAPAADLILTMGGGTLDMSNTNANEIKFADNQATSLVLKTADHNYITFVSTNSGEKVLFGRDVEFDNAVQADNTVTVGVDDTGYDVKFFGDTAGKSWLWDTSADKMVVTGDASVSGATTLSGGFSVAASQTIDMGGNRVTNVSNPSAAQDAATKSYVDAVKQALDIKDSVKLVTVAALPAVTYNNGAGTLTADANGALSVDSVAVAANDRILVKDQANKVQNGIYTVTTLGDGSTAFVLTRAEDANANTEVTGGVFVFVEGGSTQADNGFVLSRIQDGSDNDVFGNATLGTDKLTFTQFSGAGQIIDGNGIVKSGNTLNLDLANNGGLVFDSGKLKVDLSLGSIDGTLDETGGGTGNNTYAVGDLLYANATNQLTKLSKPANSSLGVFLSMTSAGVPSWESIDGGTY